MFCNSFTCNLVDIDDFCRVNSIHFISAEARGLFGSLFVDFGVNFAISTLDAEDPSQGAIADITSVSSTSDGSSDSEETEIFLDDTNNADRHQLEENSLVQISNVEGMDPINGGQFRVSKITGPYKFRIKLNSSSFPSYIRGGYFKQIKEGKILDFVCFLPPTDSQFPTPGSSRCQSFPRILSKRI